jgi:VanZ family protein
MAETRLGTARRLAGEWLPVLLWAAVIFIFSTDLFSGSNTGGVFGVVMHFIFPDITFEALNRAHFLLRKLGHFSAYFIFAVLLMRALRQENAGRIETRHLAISFAVATIYAISDEFHQSFVPSRGADIVDVLIDMSGAIAGISWSHRRNRRKMTA